jgi:hypothetical protein
MSEQPTRLRVVGGTDADLLKQFEEKLEAAKPKPRRAPRKVPMKDQLIPFRCTRCVEETGLDDTQMVQVLRNPHEANGKLIAGSLWWACARCLTPYYMIKQFGDKK